jgi:ATP-binding cassette subfamily B (MDR/TAP) protein 7
MQNMFDLTNIKTAIQDRPGCPNLIIDPKTAAIIFDNVKFRYVEGQTLFDNLSFEVPAGKKIAIVGGSGSGKSTIVRLLYRFYDPIEGRILINNQDIKDVSLDSLRNVMGIVPQDTVLFNDTILYNIHYGNFNATIDQVTQVAKISDLHETIMRMPKQYNTIVGERGLKLSGGEKQRVAIARAIVNNPRILFADEPTGNLDSKSGREILALFETLHERGVTILMVTHDPAIADRAKRRLVLADGELVGDYRAA